MGYKPLTALDDLESTIFARNYGTTAVISYNLKGIAPPVPPVQCWANKNLMSGCAAPTLKRVGGGRGENMYQEMVYYNRMHVKTRLSQSILSKIVGPLLFLLYINDFQNCSKLFDFLLFADDATFFMLINKHLVNLNDWLCANKLLLSIDK
jgi:hypothetical protein